MELYTVQQQLLALAERLDASEAQRNAAASARFAAEAELASAARRHSSVASATAEAHGRVRRLHECFAARLRAF